MGRNTVDRQAGPEHQVLNTGSPFSTCTLSNRLWTQIHALGHGIAGSLWFAHNLPSWLHRPLFALRESLPWLNRVSHCWLNSPCFFSLYSSLGFCLSLEFPSLPRRPFPPMSACPKPSHQLRLVYLATTSMKHSVIRDGSPSPTTSSPAGIILSLFWTSMEPDLCFSFSEYLLLNQI